jgi:hypothetical protein
VHKVITYSALRLITCIQKISHQLGTMDGTMTDYLLCTTENCAPRGAVDIPVIFLDFTLSPCFESRMLSSGLFPNVWSLNAKVSEHSVCSIFIGD